MKLGRISVSPGFLLLAAWLNYVDEQGIFWLGLLCCAAHEMGHLAVLYILEKPVKRICITVFGAEILMKSDLSYGQELAAAIAGPSVNLGLAAVLCYFPGGELIAGMNFLLGCFNLLPFGQMDGGRCLSCLGSILFGPGAGERTVCAVSWLVGTLAAGTGILLWRMGGNLTLLFISLWLLSGISKKAEIH